MERKRVPLGLLVVVVLLLGAGAAHARPKMDPQPAVAAGEHGMLERVWSVLSSVFDRFGASLDPSGGDGNHAVVPAGGPASPPAPDH